MVAYRQLGLGDLDQVVRLEQEVFPQEAWSPELLAEELSGPHRYYLGAFEEDGQLLGYGGIAGVWDADLMTLGVVPAARGQGLGRALTEQLIEEARQHGCERIFLEVRASNRAAHELYRSCGFIELGRVRAYYRHPTEDALRMGLELVGR